MQTNDERVERLLASSNQSNSYIAVNAPRNEEYIDESTALLDNPPVAENQQGDMDVATRLKSLDDQSDDEIRACCGSRLKHARLSKGLLLRDVVERMSEVWPNVEHVSRLQSYEAGLRMMSIGTARHLAKALGVSAAWLLCVDDTIGLEDEQLEILRLYVQAPESVRHLAMRILRQGNS